jgi:hypothetical protein
MIRPFGILSLDGGGIKGAFAASALATFEHATGRQLVEQFDLMTGTSTGGIIVIGLAMGTTAEDICWFYDTEGAIRAKGKRFTIGTMNDSLQHLSIWLSGSIPDEATPRHCCDRGKMVEGSPGQGRCPRGNGVGTRERSAALSFGRTGRLDACLSPSKT